jgi:predicted regulator of Ras-like GTPase activity (Roadblock/LC7/MglB family)
LSQQRLKIDHEVTTGSGRHVTIGGMETPPHGSTEDPTSFVGRRFLDRADTVCQLSSRLVQVAGRVTGVRAMLAVDPAGEVLVSAADVPGVNADEVAALAATLVLLARGSSSSCSMGSLSHVLVELDEGSLLVQPFADGQGSLVALVDLECDLAQLVTEVALVAGRVGLPALRTVDGRDGGPYAGRRPRSFVRPFVLTGGRTESPVAADALVWCLLEPLGRITSEQVAVLRACEKPRSIGEIAEASELPIGVVRVVVGDLMAAGWVAASMFELAASPAELYPRIVEALEALV